MHVVEMVNSRVQLVEQVPQIQGTAEEVAFPLQAQVVQA
jgi:hypothetical protein